MAQRRRRKRKNGAVRVTIRLYPSQDDDLIGWIMPLSDLPHGIKTQRIRETLRRGIGGGEQSEANPAASPDLAEVRQVVEAAVTSALARFEGQIAVPMAQVEEDEEAEELLGSLGGSLILQDETAE